MDATRLPSGLHPACSVHCVAEEAIPRHQVTDDAGHNRAAVNPHTQSYSCVLLQWMCHQLHRLLCEESEVRHRCSMLITQCRLREATDHHVCIAYGLDLVYRKSRSAIVHDDVEDVQQVNDVNGFDGRRNLSKTFDVREENGHMVESLRRHPPAGAQILSNLWWQHPMQQTLLQAHLLSQPQTEVLQQRCSLLRNLGALFSNVLLALDLRQLPGCHIPGEAACVHEALVYIHVGRAVDLHVDDRAFSVYHPGWHVSQGLPSLQPADYITQHVLVRVEFCDVLPDVLFGFVSECVQLVPIRPQDLAIRAYPMQRHGPILDEINDLGRGETEALELQVLINEAESRRGANHPHERLRS
mmetsp:Transcript_23806/g.60092  ORF Transcript_23806/g.60092 Transcript_23806/m.60092 type:complete len:356 (+) Transcript_23806:1342-2409(+)